MNNMFIRLVDVLRSSIWGVCILLAFRETMDGEKMNYYSLSLFILIIALFIFHNSKLLNQPNPESEVVKK
jgi:uncharacterized membrane protein YhaH (DUF805 family)